MKRFGILWLAAAASFGLSVVAASPAGAVTPDPQPPTIELISPTDGEIFSQSWEVLLYAKAADPDGKIIKVEFYDGSQLLATDTDSFYYYALRPRQATLGTHTFTARAYDDQGLVTTSAAVTVHIKEPIIVRMVGTVKAGVESGCLIFIPEIASAVRPQPYLLLGGDRKVIVPGAHLAVTGEVMSGVASYCMQGTPFRVESAEPI